MPNSTGIRVKPWNRVDAQVYTLATTDGAKGNLNICTYVTPIAMKPKRFVVGVYKGTKTLENLEKNPVGILQYMAQDQWEHVKLLGKKTGFTVDKVAALGASVEHAGDGLFRLKGVLAVLRLRFLERIDAGDHWAWVANVDAYENLREAEPLTFSELKRRKLILT
jgi:flavin reductase (DIM6/NTAB) family NADH-FMN oxidoreductase RutF